MGQQIVTAAQVNLIPGGLVPPQAGIGFGVDADGALKTIDPNGTRTTLGGRDMQSIVGLSAAKVLPAGFAEYWTDLEGGQDHQISFSVPLDIHSADPVNTESGGKRRLTTQAQTGVAEILPFWNTAGTNQQLALMINPKLSAWYVEGRCAIETHGANSLLFPCSIALTSAGAMSNTMATNTFCALGLAGTGYTGGNNSFLSFAASSTGTMLLQTTTIPWTSVIQSYSLHHDGAGTITARAYAPDGSMQEWTTTNLNQILATPAGFHPHQWVRCSDATLTTMLCDYLYGAGPRV